MNKIDNGVPWAEGRRALWLQNSFDGLPPRWISAVGTTCEVFVDDTRKERRQFWEVVGDANDFEWAGDAVTILEPGQCRECYEIDAHADDCKRGKRIADNLARGVPAFWAEWVMWAWPGIEAFHEDGLHYVFYALHRATGGLTPMYVDVRFGERLCHALIAFDQNGPTLAPWGLP